MKRLIAEFEEQSFTQIIFPHKQSDWAEYLQEAQNNFVEIINAVIKYQKCLVICDDISQVKRHFQTDKNLFFIEYKTDDTWARDCSALSCETTKNIELLNFTFNGWGEKFQATKDNLMSQNIARHYSKELIEIDFILEGGGIESNGSGLLLTTSACMLNKNRNTNLNREQITNKILSFFGAKELLYLEHGYLRGDDTDSHIDTLARFVSKNSIAYVQCNNTNDEHYKELKLMQEELEVFAKEYHLKLIALPMTDPIYYEQERLPATYANFLFVNGAILVPTYGVKQDSEALHIFQENFPQREIIPIDCQTLIREHGSLHCVTMNFASGVCITV